MEAWEAAWLSCRAMPPPTQALPQELLLYAHDTAERWLFDANFRCIVEEWVSPAEAEEVMAGLFYAGFCLRGQDSRKRVAPIPVLVALLYQIPLPATQEETQVRMRNGYIMAFKEWCRAFEVHGTSLRVAP